MTEILRHIAGSHSYGTSIEGISDVDHRGIYVAEEKEIRTPFFDVKEKVLLDVEDGKLFELNKFMTMVIGCNPNAVESLWVDEEFILNDSENYQLLRRHRADFLSIKIVDSLMGYAHSQLKKIKSREKWINNPKSVDKPRMSSYMSLVQNFTDEKLLPKSFKFEEHSSGNVLYTIKDNLYGIFKGNEGDKTFNSDNGDLCIRNFDRDDEKIRKDPLMYIKFDAISHNNDVKDWQNYWIWRTNRNPARSALEQEYNYDTKNASHLIRLLKMSNEVVKTNKLYVKREDAQELKDVRNGNYSYEEIIQWSDRIKTDTLTFLESGACKLPKQGNYTLAANCIMEIQNECWKS